MRVQSLRRVSDRVREYAASGVRGDGIGLGGFVLIVSDLRFRASISMTPGKFKDSMRGLYTNA